MYHHLLNNIGEGTARTVYSINENLVLKIAKNNTGVLQNATEFEISKELEEGIAKTLYSETNFKWILQDKAEKITHEKFKEFVEDEPSVFLNCLRHRYGHKSMYYSLFDNIISKYNLHRYEICSSIFFFGVIDNKLVLIDYGQKW